MNVTDTYSDLSTAAFMYKNIDIYFLLLTTVFFLPLLQYFSSVLNCIMFDPINAGSSLFSGWALLLAETFFVLFTARLLINLFVYYMKATYQTKYRRARVKFQNLKLNPLTYWL